MAESDMTPAENEATHRANAGISVSHVARSFGGVHAVRDASLTVQPGSVTALIGPNGSGKTTLLLMLASLLQPDAGSVQIGGHDPVTDPETVRRTMGWMPDALGSWGSLSVRTALQTTARMYRIEKESAAARAEELIALVGLVPLADQPARVLSRGQKQRLSLARALVHRPGVLLLDEPASGLDPAARADLRTLVRRLAGEGVAILVSSHVLAELEEMADAAVYMSAGVTASADAVARAGASLRQWRIRVVDHTRLRLPEQLASVGVEPTRISIDNLGALVSVTGEADAAALLRALVGAGAEISAFSPAVGELEHTFLDLNRAQANGETAS
ncbi:ABC transporter ATP-binding protein [Leifsonia sp. Root112D2]|uniref:ABC transporter ATP-binding protein n=1 Tax=Leifsonia sp. Root112D2 TaxID=1736426 RepID=UPI0009E8D31F|nr:ABC transporter ATP-binding protein [Leifsonia sp. Root112D2]